MRPADKKQPGLGNLPGYSPLEGSIPLWIMKTWQCGGSWFNPTQAKSLTIQDAARRGRMNVHQIVKHRCDSISDQCGLHRPLIDFESMCKLPLTLFAVSAMQIWKGNRHPYFGPISRANGSDGAGCMLTITCADSDTCKNVRASGPGAAALRSRMSVAIA